MQIQVLYFGVIRERVARTPQELVCLPAGATVDDLVSRLCDAHPELRALLRYIKVAVNENCGQPGPPGADGDEVAIIPPVAGGAEPYCRLTAEPLSVDEAIAAVSGPEQGGITVFIGVVRGKRGDELVHGLEYEAYPAMAAASMAGILRQCEALGPGLRVAAAHRIGPLRPGEIVMVVAASAPRRELAFDASRRFVELLKSQTPIWKKEFSTSGEAWVEAAEGLPGGLSWSAAEMPAAEMPAGTQPGALPRATGRSES